MRAISNVRHQSGGFPGASEIARDDSGMEFIESHYTQSARMAMHSHDFPFLHVILRGRLQNWSGSKQESGETLHVSYYPAGVPHETLWQGGGIGFSVAFSPKKATEWQDWGILPDHPVTLEPGILSALLLTARKECFLPDESGVLQAESYLTEAMGELMRLPVCAVAGKTSSRMQKVREILCDRYETLPTLSEIAQQVELHPVYLSRAFHQTFGETIGDCLRRRKIDIAVRLISRTDQSLAEIAHEVGFADQAHFTRTFKQYIGVPPTIFRGIVRPRKETVSG